MLASFAAFSLCALSLRAQGPPPGTDPVTPWPDAAVAESLKVLATLDSVVRRNRNDAAAWHRRGMISWGLMYRARVGPPYGGLDWTLLGRSADSSLRLADALEVRNPRYQLRLAQYMLGTGQTAIRAQAYPRIRAAHTALRRGRDTALLVDAKIEEARISWRFYDAIAHQVDLDSNTAGSAVSEAVGDAIEECRYPDGGAWTRPDSLFSAAKEAFRAYHAVLINCTHPIRNSGERDYLNAENLFRDAYNLAPGTLRAFRQLSMLLAEKNRWRELSSLARDRVRRAADDGWSWMVLGLAAHRLGEHAASLGLFDTALAQLPAVERTRLSALERVMRPSDSSVMRALAPEDRARAERAYWLRADPLWSRSGDDPRTEFLARVTFAELRWSVDELGVRGSDSDRGDIYVRYGPPAVIANLQLKADQPHQIVFWDYDSDLFFGFLGSPTYATVRFQQPFLPRVGDIEYTDPAKWDNILPGKVHEIPVQVARFRAPADSVDVFVASRAPVNAIQEAAATRLDIRGSFWLFDESDLEPPRDSLRFTGDGTRAWIRRVPAGNYLYRIEAFAIDAAEAARALGAIRAGADTATGFATRGFGASDVLIATAAQLRGTPARWRDFSIAPLLRPATSRDELMLIWELYEMGDRAGQAQYDVAVTIERERSAGGRVLAEILGAIASIARTNRTDDRVTITWSRVAPHAKVMVEYVTMSLRESPAGSYRLTVDVTDRVSGRRASRTMAITVGN